MGAPGSNQLRYRVQECVPACELLFVCGPTTASPWLRAPMCCGCHLGPTGASSWPGCSDERAPARCCSASVLHVRAMYRLDNIHRQFFHCSVFLRVCIFFFLTFLPFYFPFSCFVQSDQQFGRTCYARNTASTPSPRPLWRKSALGVAFCVFLATCARTGGGSLEPTGTRAAWSLCSTRTTQAHLGQVSQYRWGLVTVDRRFTREAPQYTCIIVKYSSPCHIVSWSLGHSSSGPLNLVVGWRWSRCGERQISLRNDGEEQDCAASQAKFHVVRHLGFWSVVAGMSVHWTGHESHMCESRMCSRSRDN